MPDRQLYDMGERGYIAAVAEAAGLPLGAARCAHPGCATPTQPEPCEYALCPRKEGNDG